MSNKDTNKIYKVGNASVENSQAGCVFAPNGVFPTVCACTHGYAIGYILVSSSQSTSKEKEYCDE